uniref:Uncharacterized protein n=1 Tax=Acrobeloides nanus TaxID=290746 RepID=A0A914CJV2_9BILA
MAKVASSEHINISIPKYSDEPNRPISKGLPLIFRANDVPKWHTSILLAFQQTMVCMPGIFVFPYIIADNVCAGLAGTAIRAQLISTTFIITGIATILQTTLGL